MPRAAKPTRLPGGGLSMATEPDFFVKQGDFQALAAGRPALFYRDLTKARADWERGWRELFIGSVPHSVDAIDAALGFDPDADLDDEPTDEADEGDESDESDGSPAG
jgi:hypothetical protein